MDLFYDGSQDIPLPFEDRAGRTGESRREGDPCFCESCNAPVSAEDLASGAATEVYGLTLCGECRSRSRSEERIELYFCDRCHVSVPVYRVDTGEALAGDGRIFCVACRERKTRFRGTRVAALALALLASFAAGAFWFSLRGPKRAPERMAPVPPDAAIRSLARTPGEKTAALAARMTDLTTRLEAALAGMDSLEADRVGEREKLAAARDLLGRMREEFEVRMDLLEGEAAALRRDLERALDRPIPER